MRGDFSRIRFEPGKGYTAVLEQQGRVALDADANEQCFIDGHRARLETTDVVGEYGAPAADAGFQITVSGGEIEIGAGRYYVDGLLCENPEPLSYDAQPFLPDPSPSGTTLLSELRDGAAGTVLQIYLEAWERLATGLDDPELLEPALGQADTTARLQTVWRVVGAPVVNATPTTSEPPGMTPCCQAMYEGTVAQSTGTMTAGTAGASSDCGCQPVVAAGYQGIENQLYRVEIHTGGDETQATFKWSRENGSVVSAVTGVSGATIDVSSLGRDANLSFQVNQWVELTDDTNQFGEPPNRPGTLYQVQQLIDSGMVLSGDCSVDPTRNARVRRWDQTGPSATAGGMPLQAGSFVALENGIQVQFSAGSYAPGDYWTIPARTATGQIDWPAGPDGFEPPLQTRVRRAPLACIHWVSRRIPTLPATTARSAGEARETRQPEARALLGGESTITRGHGPVIGKDPPLDGSYTPDDCRMLFEPLTALANPTAATIHITEVSGWSNDDVITLDQLLATGLVVQFDQAPTGPVNAGNFIVTLEPFMLPTTNFDAQGGALVSLPPGGLPATVARGLIVLDSTVTVSGQTVTWTLPTSGGRLQPIELDLIRSELTVAAAVGEFARVRVRLLGEAIFASGASGTAYLDGRAFGTSAIRSDGSTPRIGQIFPTGRANAVSDFESWFYLAPQLAISSVDLNFDTVTVVLDVFNGVSGVQAAAGGPDVTVDATVTLSYPTLTAVDLTFSVTSASVTPAGTTMPTGDTIVAVPAPVTIPAGSTTATVPVSVIGNPGANVALQVLIAAQATLPSGAQLYNAADLTVNGAPPRQIIFKPPVPEPPIKE